MYQERTESSLLFQGDLISDFPVITIPNTELDLLFAKNDTYPYDAEVHKSNEIQDAFKNGLEKVVVDAYKSSVIILSQTCDIQNRELVVISPIFPLTNETSASKRKSIVQYRVNYRFFLPSKPDLINDSFADFNIIYTVKRDSIDINKRFLSLDSQGISLLIDNLYRYFCRPVIPKYIM